MDITTQVFSLGLSEKSEKKFYGMYLAIYFQLVPEEFLVYFLQTSPYQALFFVGPRSATLFVRTCLFLVSQHRTHRHYP